MTHLTQEGSLEDTIIVVRFYCDFNPNNKKDEPVNARLNCSSSTSCARFNVSIHSPQSAIINQIVNLCNDWVEQ